MDKLNPTVPADPTINISSLIDVLNYFHPVSEEVKGYLREHIHACNFPKGKLILKAGQVCEHIYFIQKGAVRGFIKDGRKDVTTWITAENELVSSISGFADQEPALENMQTIEACEMLVMSFNDLQNLYEQFPEFNIVSRKLLQHYYRDAEGRAFIARLSNAESKYKYFISNNPHLVNRIPLKYVASFLGITLETLSRVRRKILVSRSK